VSARLLDDCLTVFRRWLFLDDPAPLYAVAAAVAANLAPGDPVWLLLVAPPSTGKTEVLQSVSPLPYVHPVATLTEPALLSGSPKKDVSKQATGGMLRQVGDFGVLLAKDFTSVLSMQRDSRSQVLAALREIYDGSWDRPVGADGGNVLHWDGKCGLIGGVTPVLDRHHAVIAGLGDRFILLRLPDVDPASTGALALAHVGYERQMRQELADAMSGLVAGADISMVSRALTAQENARLIALATYTVRARTGVERDGYTSELLLMPQIEGPGRLVTALRRMLGGLEAIGCDPDTAWSIVGRIAIDCVPAIRTALIRVLLTDPHVALRTSAAAERVGMVTRTASRHLEDLALLGLATRTKKSEADNSADLWSASDWLIAHWPESTTEIPPPIHETLVRDTGDPESLSHLDGSNAQHPDSLSHPADTRARGLALPRMGSAAGRDVARARDGLGDVLTGRGLAQHPTCIPLQPTPTS